MVTNNYKMESAKSSVSYVSDQFCIQTEELSKLVCPVCYEYMTPPIMQCEIGHGICELCHELLSDCPICHRALIHRRSSHLEILTSLVLFPCKTCNLKYSLNDLTSHKCVDEETKINCLIGQVYGDCTWIGWSKDLTEHCRKRHPKNYWTRTMNIATWNYCHLSSIGIQNIYLLDLDDTVFVLVQKFDSVTHSLQWNISCECEKNSEQYIYEIELFSEYESNSLKYKNTIENEENIVTFFPCNNEISIPVNKVIDYLCDNFLRYKIMIHKDSDNKTDEVIKNFTYSDVKQIEFSPRVSMDHAKDSCSQKTCNSVLHVYNFVKKRLSCSK